MYIELLKKLYYQERKKLELLAISEKESRIRLLKKKRDVVERLQERLTISELMGRSDILDEVKDTVIRDQEDKLKESLGKKLDEESVTLEAQEQEELTGLNYTPEDYAEYLVQFEKVYALEDILSEERLFPDSVYEEQKLIFEKIKGSGKE
jgi:hypothetical protein